MRRLVLGIVVTVAALMPAVSMADDQQIADYIKSRLQVEQSKGSLRGFNVDMRVDRGTVWFKGFVASPQQEMLILRTAQKAGHLGVVQVVDDIEVKGATAAPAQYQQAAYQQQSAPQMQMPRMQMPQPRQMPQPSPSDYGYGQVAYQQQAQTPPMPNAMQQQMSARGAIANNTPMAFASSGQQAISGAPMSMASAPMAGGAGMVNESPNLPGYAWPSYAAAPNYAGVSYPQQYSPQAWPYIGPFYPYPQVPLGWRKVSLEWDDGWWQLDFSDK